MPTFTWRRTCSALPSASSFDRRPPDAALSRNRTIEWSLLVRARVRCPHCRFLTYTPPVLSDGRSTNNAAPLCVVDSPCHSSFMHGRYSMRAATLHSRRRYRGSQIRQDRTGMAGINAAMTLSDSTGSDCPARQSWPRFCPPVGASIERPCRFGRPSRPLRRPWPDGCCVPGFASGSGNTRVYIFTFSMHL